MSLGQAWPTKSEVASSGRITGKIGRNSPDFQKLVKNTNPGISFKREDCRRMTSELMEKLDILADKVTREWPGTDLRVTAAWDAKGHHPNSLHYEGRAADLTTSDKDLSKYGRLAQLARESGFSWVWYEDKIHVHASVKENP
jgi:hypothetical protein